MENKKFHRAWVVLIGCCFLMMALALLTTCMGFFIKPVCDALGFERGAFTIYYSIAGLIGVFAMPMWGRIIPKIGIKPAVAIGGTGGAIFMFLFGFCKSLPAFYILGLFMGIMVAGITVLPTSILINTWFQEKRGLAMGIAMACSGVGGAVFSPVLQNIITSHGWQAGYMANGVGLFILTVPVALLLLKGSPAEVGLKPYGAIDDKTSSGSQQVELVGVASGTALKSGPFFALALAIVILNMVTGSIQHMPAHFANIGISAAAASGIVSIIMLTVIVSKILLGIVNDRFGSLAAVTLAFILMAIGFAGFAMFKAYGTVIIFAVFYAVGLASTTVMAPLLTGQMFGQKDYSAIYAIIGAMGSLGLALGTPLIGVVYDKTGTYTPAFYICIIAIIITFALLSYALKASKKLWA